MNMHLLGYKLKKICRTAGELKQQITVGSIKHTNRSTLERLSVCLSLHMFIPNTTKWILIMCDIGNPQYVLPGTLNHDLQWSNITPALHKTQTEHYILCQRPLIIEKPG
jgi:hypothetical protein